MKVIVNVSGFYGGTWHEASKAPQEMPDAVAKQFLPPHGDQLAIPAEPKPAPRSGGRASAPAEDEKKVD